MATRPASRSHAVLGGVEFPWEVLSSTRDIGSIRLLPSSLRSRFLHPFSASNFSLAKAFTYSIVFSTSTSADHSLPWNSRRRVRVMLALATALADSSLCSRFAGTLSDSPIEVVLARGSSSGSESSGSAIIPIIRFN